MRKDKKSINIFIFDTETTGVPRRNGEIVDYTEEIYEKKGRMLEIAYQICDKYGNLIKKKQFLIKKTPDFQIDNEEWHLKNSGITLDMLINYGKELNEVLDNIHRRLKKCRLILSYNIQFDISILLSECYRLERYDIISTILNTKKICVMKLFQENGKYQKLDILYQKTFGVFPPKTHRALEDVKLCKEIFFNRYRVPKNPLMKNSFRRWNCDDDIALKTNLLEGKTLSQLIKTFQRNESGIISRLVKIMDDTQLNDKVDKSIIDKMLVNKLRYTPVKADISKLLKSKKSMKDICNIVQKSVYQFTAFLQENNIVVN